MTNILDTAFLAYLLGAIALHGLLAVGLFWWGRRIARRRTMRTWRILAWLPFGALALFIFAAVSAFVFVSRAATSLASADQTQRATLMAAAISESMNCAALFILPAWALYLLSLILFAVGSLRKGARTLSEDRDRRR